MICRDWLKSNNYEDVADLIDLAIARIEAKGKKSRRNGWDHLAGKHGGIPRVREGMEFPILRVAQIRQGVPVTPNAVCRNENELPPDVVATKRWPKKTLPARTKRLIRKTSRSRHAQAS